MFSAIRDLWWLTRSCRRLVYALLGLALINQLCTLAVPVAIGRVVDVSSTGDPDYIRQQVPMVVVGIFLALLVIDIMRYFQRHAMIRLTHKTRGSLICSAFAHLLHLPVSFHEDKDTGGKTKTIQNGVDKTLGLADDWTSQGIPVLLLYTFSSTLLAYYWPLAGIILGVGVPAMVALSVLFYRLGKKPREERHDCYEASESLLVEGIQNVSTIQSFRMEDSHIQRMHGLWQRVYAAGVQEMKSADIGFFIRNTTILLSITSVIWFGMHRVAQGLMTSGVLITVLFLVLRMTNELWSLGIVIDSTIQNAPSLQRLRELFLAQSNIQEQPLAVHLSECRGHIEFNSVSFAYPGTKTPALTDVSLSIEPGSTVALVGPSGAGKSTLFKLVGRQFDPTTGAVRLDGHDLRNLRLNFRGNIAIVSQETEVFSDTIANNIAVGRKDLLRQDIEHFAKIACLDDFVEDLPDGLDTQIGERGLKLSGGQRQRLAIARALAADCKIILFDEATSHLDGVSEARIREAMENLMGSHTILIIAHRLSTVKHADKIIVLDEGRIVEQGTHTELKRLHKGVYRKHLQIQTDTQSESA